MFTCGLHLSSVDAPVDIHGRSYNFPFFHPRETLLVGCWVTTLPFFSCGILSFPPPVEVVLHGVGLVHLSHVWWLPMHKGTPISDMQWEEVSFGGGLMTIHVGSSLCKRGCQPWFDAPPPKSLLPTYPWASSFPSRHLPSLVPGHQVSSSLCLFFHVIVPFLLVCFSSWLGLHLPQGTPQSIPYRSHIHVHTPGGGLSHGGLIAANSGEDKVDWEPRPLSKH